MDQTYSYNLACAKIDAMFGRENLELQYSPDCSKVSFYKNGRLLAEYDEFSGHLEIHERPSRGGRTIQNPFELEEADHIEEAILQRFDETGLYD